MPFQVSPGVNVSEIDLTTVVPAVSTTEGAIAGVFRWGPVGKRVLVDSEAILALRFGKPTNHNPETFFSAANFLAYGNKLYVSRAANTTSIDTSVLTRNAVANVNTITDFANGEADAASYVVKSDDHYDNVTFDDTDVLYVAKYPGVIGNSLKVSVCDSPNAYSLSYNIANNGNSGVIDTSLTNSSMDLVVGSNTANVHAAYDGGTQANVYSWVEGLRSKIQVGDIIEAGNTTVGIQYLKVTAVSSSTTNTVPFAHFSLSFENAFQLSQNVNQQTIVKKWEYFNVVDTAPGVSAYQSNFGSNTSAVDELHVVVVDEDGEFSGVPGTILEVFQAVSRNSEAKTEDGSTNYYKTVINDTSNYIWWANHRSGAAGANSSAVASSANETPL
jgi:hypothetical protein